MAGLAASTWVSTDTPAAYSGLYFCTLHRVLDKLIWQFKRVRCSGLYILLMFNFACFRRKRLIWQQFLAPRLSGLPSDAQHNFTPWYEARACRSVLLSISSFAH
jgi:hypothetical protein